MFDLIKAVLTVSNFDQSRPLLQTLQLFVIDNVVSSYRQQFVVGSVTTYGHIALVLVLVIPSCLRCMQVAESFAGARVL